MIVGVGIDVVDVDRFMRTLERTPGLRDRVFTAVEAVKPPASLAARFAAKEALAKALGAPRHGAQMRRHRDQETAIGLRIALDGEAQPVRPFLFTRRLCHCFLPYARGHDFVTARGQRIP